MSGMNKVMILGHLGDKPNLKHTDSGSAVANLSLATSRQWVNDRGDKQEDTEWHRIVAWGKQGENCAKYLTKGDQILVEGYLKTREWTDKEGIKRFTTEIVSERVHFPPKGGRS
jgi:single-strand DNA-binding protein